MAYENRLVSKYLTDNGWQLVDGNLWIDLRDECGYKCHEKVAVSIQLIRGAYKGLPWYKKLYRKLFCYKV